MYRRSNEKFFTLLGVFAGSFMGNYIGGGSAGMEAGLITAVVFALVIGLICNKIGSELDRSRFLEENEITPVKYYEYIPARKKMPREEYKKLTFKEKIRLWINEAEDTEICSDGQKK